MRRIFIFLLCVAALITSVSAASGITSADSKTTVDRDGTCQVSLSFHLRLDHTIYSLSFPLPGQARDITLNGQRVTASRKDAEGNRLVDLSEIASAPGSYTISLRYSLPDAVRRDGDRLLLTIPMLSGFGYPLEAMAFSITLPGAPEFTPSFFSTYYQDTVALHMTCSVKDKTISGSFNQSLPDHEALTMTLEVTDTMFPQNVAKRWSMDQMDLLMICTAVLTVIYWLVSMGCLPPQRIHHTAPPAGITPGDLGCHLTGQGVDFTMLVISWAQMGYLLIHLDDSGRVLLHKRMEMGNERSDFEYQAFRRLFGKRKLIDSSSDHYSTIAALASGKTPGLRLNYRPNSGNPWILRLIATILGVVGGLSITVTLFSDTTARTAFGILFGILWAVLSWQMQSAMYHLHTRRKRRVLRGLLCAAVAIAAAVLTEEWLVAFGVIPLQFLVGLGAAYGGHRTQLGRQTMEEILALRRYLRTVSPQELNRIQKHNPDYFYEMATWAMSLGSDRAFARQFGLRRLRQCTYLTTGMDGHLTAREWNQILHAVVSVLDSGTKRYHIQKLLRR